MSKTDPDIEPDCFENDISGPAMDLSGYATLPKNLLIHFSLEKKFAVKQSVTTWKATHSLRRVSKV
jgi:hypothetical protein